MNMLFLGNCDNLYCFHFLSVATSSHRGSFNFLNLPILQNVKNFLNHILYFYFIYM